MFKNCSVVCIFFQILFFSGLFLLSEKLAHIGDVLPRLRVLTDKVNCSSGYHTAQMKDAVQASDSGLEGNTHSKVMSGVPGGKTSVRPASVEFAVALVENDKPSYSRSIFIKSDEQGKFKISLPPGKYWLGPKGKALDPINYAPGSFSISEELVVVRQGAFTKIDLFQVGYAP
jgi:hypothetical protein